jgi:hypothetical protein
MKSRSILAIAAAIAVGVFTPTALAGNDDGGSASAAPLTGESLLASELGEPGTSTVEGTCNPLGTSTFTFTVTGTAFGPYPGTFTESGTVTLSSLPTATSFESTFTISSPAGTVTGSKSLAGFEASSLGLCGATAFPTGGANSLLFEGTLSYEATITTPLGTATDSGESFVSLQDTQVRGRAGFNGFNFAESYTSTQSIPCDDDENDDDDHQGDQDDQDCDDEDEDDDDQGEDD